MRYRVGEWMAASMAYVDPAGVEHGEPLVIVEFLQSGGEASRRGQSIVNCDLAIPLRLVVGEDPACRSFARRSGTLLKPAVGDEVAILEHKIRPTLGVVETRAFVERPHGIA